MLGIASVLDIQTREVTNKLWVIFLPLGTLLTTLSIIGDSTQIILIITSIAITSGIALLIFYLGLYGGADAKALISLSIAHPLASIPPLQTQILPLTTLTNSLLLMLFSTPVALIKNIHWKLTTQKPLFDGLEHEPVWKKLATLFLCTKVSRNSIKPYNIIAEQHSEEGVKQLKLFQQVLDEDTIVDEHVPNHVFIAFSLPMLPFILVGYVITLTIGDLIFHLLAIIM
jgi:preflagellin peptidase FlaK